MPKAASNTRSVPIFNRDIYTPIQFITLATRYSRSASQLYLRRFGVGITEWRIVSVLSFETDITANEIAGIISTNKAAISRSLVTLNNGGFIRYASAAESRRNRAISLTSKGRMLNAQIVPVALAREKLLLSGFSQAEKTVLLDFLRRLNQAMPDVESYDLGS